MQHVYATKRELSPVRRWTGYLALLSVRVLYAVIHLISCIAFLGPQRTDLKPRHMLCTRSSSLLLVLAPRLKQHNINPIWPSHPQEPLIALFGTVCLPKPSARNFSDSGDQPAVMGTPIHIVSHAPFSKFFIYYSNASLTYCLVHCHTKSTQE